MSIPIPKNVDIEIELDMDTVEELDADDVYPRPVPCAAGDQLNYFQQASTHPRTSSKINNIPRHKTQQEFDYYYVIPPCPPPPPPKEHSLQSSALVVSYPTQNVMAPVQCATGLSSPSYLTPDSIYTGASVKSPVMIPRAPSPPLSPPRMQRSRQHPRRSRFSGNPMEGPAYDRGYRW